MAGKDNTWRIRNVSPETHKKVKLYAVEHGLSVAQALDELVERALRTNKLILTAFDKASDGEDPLVVRSIRKNLNK